MAWPLKDTWAAGEEFFHYDQNDVAKAINRQHVVIEAHSAPGGTASLSGNIPADAVGVRVIRMVGPGGPGGSGAFNPTASTNRCGGGAGAGGNVVTERFYPKSAFGAGTTWSAVAPAPGNGGASIVGTNSSGNPGATVGDAVLTIGSLVITASAGGPGVGGTGSAAPGGTPGTRGDLFGTAGSGGTTSSVPTAVPDSPTVAAGAKSYGAAAGGGGGSGISSGGVTGATAGTGGKCGTTNGGSPGTSAGATPTSPGAPVAGEPGAGAGGGALPTAGGGIGQDGADGAGFGSGGGGGSGAGGAGGVRSGKGGKGGPSYIAFMWVY